METSCDKDQQLTSKEVGGLDEYLKPFQTARRCNLCNNSKRKNISKGILQSRVAFDFAPVDLETSAPSCPYCAILLTAIQQFEPEIHNLTSSVVWIYARGSAELLHDTLSLEIYFKCLRPKFELELFAQSSSGHIASNSTIQLAKQAFQPRKTISEESLSWVRSHIGECQKNHSKCLNILETMLPSRVLSLTATSTGSIQVMLVETGGMLGTYACLSHRWGGPESGIATRSSYASLLKGIPWASIPPTFQDAIRFALFIGIKNIWIDSLCIIQDDPSDWREQAARMASIYQNSYITLAATTSLNNEAGCCWDSDTCYERTFTSEAGPFSVRRKLKHWEKLWTSNSANTFPLLTRAWVFQECLLPPRVLHFSHNEFVWECMQLGDCQCGGYNSLSNPKCNDWASKSSWRLAVELFTSLQLTREQDRLPALLGFADFYAQSLGASLKNEYFAGLWKKSLHTDLLWRVDSPALNLGSRATRLCRCFDFVSESDEQLRCQYSYSAACSPQCLERRRFCRFGQPEAAVSYLSKFEGSCSRKEDTTTSIQELRQLYGRVEFNDSHLIPSWSWVSAGTGVKFWDYVQHVPPAQGSKRNFLTPCEVSHIQVEHEGQNLVGPVRSAVLRIDGWIACALLQYRYDADLNDKRIQHHSIFRYGLVIGDSRRPLEFYPDYALCLEGQRWIPAGTPLFLLHVSSGVHLVLQQKEYFESGWKSRTQRALQSSVQRARLENFFTNRSEFKLERKFVRIGVLRSPKSSEDTTYWETL